MTVPPVLALKAADTSRQAVAKSLTGDIYVKRWSTVKKRPKRKGGPQVVDHELHINPVSVGLGLVALGGAAMVGAAALWLGQRKVTYGADDKNPATMWRIVKQYEAQTNRPERVVVTTLRGVPVRTYQGYDTTADAILSEREKSLGWKISSDADATTVLGEGKDKLGSYLKMKYKFVNPTKKRLGTTEREGFLA